MRSKKGRGKIPNQIWFTENDILDACREYAEKHGHTLGDRAYVKIRPRSKDKLGRSKHANVEVGFDVQETS